MNKKEVEHVRMCPLGWFNGQLVRTRATTDEDVIEWVAKLRELAGLDRPTPSAASENVRHE